MNRRAFLAVVGLGAAAMGLLAYGTRPGYVESLKVEPADVAELEVAGDFCDLIKPGDYITVHDEQFDIKQRMKYLGGGRFARA